jgi:hypothetical protein
MRPPGRIPTTVPNLRGIKWLLQRMADLETLRIHVIYDARRLRRVHERAGFRTVAAGCAGFFDGFLSSAAGARSRIRCDAHRRLCRALNLCAEAWTRIGRGRGTPEMPWISPHVFYVGEAAGERAATPRAVRGRG